MPTRVKLPKSWPPIAGDIVLDAAHSYCREMKEAWPVPDVIMERVLNAALFRREREIYEEAPARWIKRWESGKLDAEMKLAIEETFRRLSRAESAIRPRASTRKKIPARSTPRSQTRSSRSGDYTQFKSEEKAA